MSQVARRLESAYQKAQVIPFDHRSKFVLISDCHRGQGNIGDNFLKNQNLFYGAMDYYDRNGFTYIELGDGDELWENRNMKQIINIHSDAFALLSRMYKQGRLYMLYGNHDIVKSRPSFLKKHCTRYYCDMSNRFQPLFPDIQIVESLILEEKSTKQRLFLVHGHQGDLLNDTLWPLARFLVRYFWRPLELVGFIAPVGAARANEKKDKIEKGLAKFAKKKQQIMIAGHTHRPVFPNPGEGYYFNDGSCVHPRGMTAIEIENNQISLVKWLIATREDRSLFVDRQILKGPQPLLHYQ